MEQSIISYEEEIKEAKEKLSKGNFETGGDIEVSLKDKIQKQINSVFNKDFSPLIDKNKTEYIQKGNEVQVIFYTEKGNKIEGVYSIENDSFQHGIFYIKDESGNLVPQEKITRLEFMLMEKGGDIKDELSNVFYIVVDMDERGEYGATIYNSKDEQVWEIETGEVHELQEDGILKYKPHEDLDRLSKYLAQIGKVPEHTNILTEDYYNQLREESRETGGKVDSRIEKMINGWKENGVAYSTIHNLDVDFFEAIGVPYEKLGITSQTGNDIVYYDTNIYKSGHNALRGIKHARGGKLKNAKLMIINSSNPLSKQLQKETGKSWNDINFKDISVGNFNIVTDKDSGQIFIVYPERIYEELNEHARKDDLDYLKNMEGIEVVDVKAIGGDTQEFSIGNEINTKIWGKVLVMNKGKNKDGLMLYDLIGLEGKYKGQGEFRATARELSDVKMETGGEIQKQIEETKEKLRYAKDFSPHKVSVYEERLKELQSELQKSRGSMATGGGVGDVKKYKNKYGSLELELMEDYKDIKGVRGKDYPDDVKFTMETAEQIALITDNRGIQISFEYPKLDKAYVMIHKSPSTIAVAKIKNIYFDKNINPQDEIAKIAKFRPTNSMFLMENGGGVGSFEYKTIDTTTEKGLKEAEKLQSQGWKVISSGIASDKIQFERPKRKKEIGCEVNEGIDLFEHQEDLPSEVKEILDKYSEEDNTYESLGKMQSELEPLGYTFDYYLDAEPYGLRKMATGGGVDYSFDYQMLGRLQSDCDYYLGHGNRSEKNLWAGNVDAQIEEMKRLWNKLPIKPEWLSMEDILEYEKKMKGKSGSMATGGELAVANEIRNQVGNKALYMLGAKDLAGDAHSFSFKIRGSKKWKHIKIFLNGKDLYDVTFTTWHGEKITNKTVNDVYNDNLLKVIEEETGLYTKLATGGAVGTLTYAEFNKLYHKFYEGEHKWSSYPSSHVISSIYDEYLKSPELYKWLFKYAEEGGVGEVTSLIIPYREIMTGTKGVIDLSKSREDLGKEMAKNYALENKKRVTPRMIENFTSDAGAYHRVRDILEGIKTTNFNDVIKVFKEVYPKASTDWKGALKTGLVIKAKEREGNYSDTPFIYNDALAEGIREKGINFVQPIIDEILSSSMALGGKIGDRVKFISGNGYWDVTKYPYGGDFKRMKGGEEGVIIEGTIKIGGEMRVKLDDGRIIVIQYQALDLPSMDEKRELYERNKHLFTFGRETGGAIGEPKQVYWTLPKKSPVHEEGTQIIIERNEKPVGELGHTGRDLYLYKVYMQSPNGKKYWIEPSLMHDKALERAEQHKYTIEAGYKVADLIELQYTKK